MCKPLVGKMNHKLEVNSKAAGDITVDRKLITSASFPWVGQVYYFLLLLYFIYLFYYYYVMFIIIFYYYYLLFIKRVYSTHSGQLRRLHKKGRKCSIVHFICMFPQETSGTVALSSWWCKAGTMTQSTRPHRLSFSPWWPPSAKESILNKLTKNEKKTPHTF